MDKANPVIMDSSTYGLPISSRLGYRETIPYATRISTDGIYLHQLNATVWAQGNTDTSHGCLNLNGDNAEWFFDFSVPGDVVEVRNTGGPPLQLTQNGDWSCRGASGSKAVRCTEMWSGKLNSTNDRMFAAVGGRVGLLSGDKKASWPSMISGVNGDAGNSSSTSCGVISVVFPRRARTASLVVGVCSWESW